MREAIESIFRAIDKVCAENGIDANGVQVLAATKTVEPERINRLPSLGIMLAGENRVQEFLSKFEHVHGVKWHFIGALQTNKVKYIIDKVEMIHSVDRISLADEIDLRAGQIGKKMDVLIEINVGGELSKSGVSVDEFHKLLDYCEEKPNLRVRGIMSVLPKDADEKLYDKLQTMFAKKKGGCFDTLSVGMSADYLTAIKHGANLVRPGSIIFGKRS